MLVNVLLEYSSGYLIHLDLPEHLISCGWIFWYLICRPPRMNPEKFCSVDFLPDPEPDQTRTRNDPTANPGEELHYKCFEYVFQTATTEDHRPSKNPPKKKPSFGHGFSPSQRHVTNVDMMLQCSECDQWRLVFCKTKLSRTQKATLKRIMDDVDYTCGATFGEF